MPSDTPVFDWPSTGGDAELARLERCWKQARIQADIALAQHGPWDELTHTANSHTGRGLDVLIPPQRKLGPSQGRRVTMAEAEMLS